MPSRARRLASLIDRCASPARRPVTRRRVAVGVASVLCVALLAAVARDWAATLDATDEARARTDEARATLADTDADLADTREATITDDATLADEAQGLSASQAARAEVQGTYDATQAWLAALQAQLAAATTELEASTSRVTVLQTCLAGAAEALNQAAARDTSGAAATIRDIEGVCAEAGVEL